MNIHKVIVAARFIAKLAPCFCKLAIVPVPTNCFEIRFESKCGTASVEFFALDGKTVVIKARRRKCLKRLKITIKLFFYLKSNPRKDMKDIFVIRRFLDFDSLDLLFSRHLHLRKQGMIALKAAIFQLFRRSNRRYTRLPRSTFCSLCICLLQPKFKISEFGKISEAKQN